MQYLWAKYVRTKWKWFCMITVAVWRLSEPQDLSNSINLGFIFQKSHWTTIAHDHIGVVHLMKNGRSQLISINWEFYINIWVTAFVQRTFLLMNPIRVGRFIQWQGVAYTWVCMLCVSLPVDEIFSLCRPITLHFHVLLLTLKNVTMYLLNDVE